MSRSAENQYTNMGMSRDGSKSQNSPTSNGPYSERNIFGTGHAPITLERVRGVEIVYIGQNFTQNQSYLPQG